MSDEEDYMSDKFLFGDVRPSLVQQSNKKRQLALEDKKQENIKRQKQESKLRKGIVDNQTLEESLRKPIEKHNKGFQMLAKMGYRPGQALGCENSCYLGENRLLEPISFSIKADRGGLGREAALLDLSEKRRQIREKQLHDRQGVDQFRKREQRKAEERLATAALKHCQLSCETIDLENGIKEPELSWFWPERQDNLEESVSDEKGSQANTIMEAMDDEEEFTSIEKLEMITSYLRTAYIFCFWCGVRYKDQEDMNSNCPGKMRDDH